MWSRCPSLSYWLRDRCWAKSICRQTENMTFSLIWQQPLAYFPILLILIGLIWRYSHQLQLVLSWVINVSSMCCEQFRCLESSLLIEYLQFILVTSVRITDTPSSKHLPRLAYTWPDGQGNLAKFIHGRENSKAWKEKYGAIYQIWAGMQPEV